MPRCYIPYDLLRAHSRLPEDDCKANLDNGPPIIKAMDAVPPPNMMPQPMGHYDAVAMAPVAPPNGDDRSHVSDQHRDRRTL